MSLFVKQSEILYKIRRFFSPQGQDLSSIFTWIFLGIILSRKFANPVSCVFSFHFLRALVGSYSLAFNWLIYYLIFRQRWRRNTIPTTATTDRRHRKDLCVLILLSFFFAFLNMFFSLIDFYKIFIFYVYVSGMSSFTVLKPFLPPYRFGWMSEYEWVCDWLSESEWMCWVSECVEWVSECVEWVRECVEWVSECVEWVSECVEWVNVLSEWENVLSEWENVLSECVDWVSECVEWVSVLIEVSECVEWVSECVEWVSVLSEWVNVLSEWVSEWVNMLIDWVSEYVDWVSEWICWLSEWMCWVSECVDWVFCLLWKFFTVIFLFIFSFFY